MNFIILVNFKITPKNIIKWLNESLRFKKILLKTIKVKLKKLKSDFCMNFYINKSKIINYEFEKNSKIQKKNDDF